MARDRGTLLLMGGVLLLGLLLRAYGLPGQPPIMDEVMTAYSAVNYMENGQFGPTMWNHPHLRNIVIYLVGEAFGYGPYALRGMSLLTGVLSIPLVGMILLRLTGNRTAALLAAFLLAIEQVHITFSRQAIQETWTTFFFLAGVLLTLAYRDRDKPWLLLAAGIAFGFGMTCKFHAFFPLVVCLGFSLYQAWRRRSWDQGLFVVCSLICIPLASYLVSYLAWFGRGYGLGDWVRMHQAIFSFTTTHQGFAMDQTIDKVAWQWFLRPMGYANFVFAEGKPYLSVAYSNPLIWLLVIPATLLHLYRVLARRGEAGENRGIAFLLALFLVSYAPLAVNIRPIWLLSALAVTPFALMLVAVALQQVAGRMRWGRQLLAVYLIAATAGSLYLYPLAVGEGMVYPYLAPIAEHFRQDMDPVQH